MEKEVEELLERNYQKLNQLKISEKREVWAAITRQDGEFVMIKSVKLTGLPYAELKKFPFKITPKIYRKADKTETIIVEEFIKNSLTESEAEKILPETRRESL